MHAIETRDLIKTYPGDVRALDGLSFSAVEGSVFGLLGPNGAGKSTTVKILTTLSAPDAGQASVAGFDVLAEPAEVRKAIGVVAQRSGLDREATGRENLKLQGQLHDLGGRELERRVDELMEQFGLAGAARRLVREYSGGMQRRLDIALALVHRPRVLFLDEPTAGVDVELRRDMWQLMRRLRDQGVTIILTTHYIAEAEEMADRVGVIHKGELILVEKTTELMGKLGKKQLTLHLQEPLHEIPAGLAAWALELNGEGTELRLSFRAGEEQSCIPALLRRIGELGIEFRDLNTRQSSLEEIFVDLVRDQ